MLPLLLLTLLTTASPYDVPAPQPSDSTAYYYAHKDTAGLVRLCQGAADRPTDLLCRYRLFPLTKSESLLEGLPDELPEATAQELALLSGLWGYRTAQAAPWNAVRYGLRAARLLEAAQAVDPVDPYVLMVEGQSLLFRPAIAGGDPAEALRTFEALIDRLDAGPPCDIARDEASMWRWYALAKLDDPRAEPVRQQLLAQNPAPLFAEFLRMKP